MLLSLALLIPPTTAAAACLVPIYHLSQLAHTHFFNLLSSIFTAFKELGGHLLVKTVWSVLVLIVCDRTVKWWLENPLSMFLDMITLSGRLLTVKLI